ncbi:hypothetical protein CVT24_007220 [Panaeolus cyanescens]|uniref:Phytocyanin domain-containing protein n=1 Tax=Panaeolus cyanescens TaxID=181874 RepID=A0A409VJF3_9AGAR|nr:hypothetical protein CVT24_007220 [Panaeolus cyanescens]
MRFFNSALLAVSAIVSAVSAVEYNVIVGKDNLNVYDPPSITGVQNGDTIKFRLLILSAVDQSVTQSTFDKPCTAREPGVDSGFFPVEAGATVFPEWTIRIDNATAPLWFFCNRAPHCAAGMVFAINPTAERTFDTFQAIAKGEATATPAAGTPATTDAPAPGTDAPSGGAAGLSAPKFASIIAALGVVASLAL